MHNATRQAASRGAGSLRPRRRRCFCGACEALRLGHPACSGGASPAQAHVRDVAGLRHDLAELFSEALNQVRFAWRIIGPDLARRRGEAKVWARAYRLLAGRLEGPATRIIAEHRAIADRLAIAADPSGKVLDLLPVAPRFHQAGSERGSCAHVGPGRFHGRGGHDAGAGGGCLEEAVSPDRDEFLAATRSWPPRPPGYSASNTGKQPPSGSRQGGRAAPS